MLCGEDPDSDTDAHTDFHGGGSANSNTAGACDVERRQRDTREDDDALPSVASEDGGLISCADSTANDGAPVSGKPPPQDKFQMSAGEAASIRAAMSTFDLPAPEWARGLDVSLSVLCATPVTEAYLQSRLLERTVREHAKMRCPCPLFSHARLL